MALTTLVCYDVSSDNARARIAATLQHWGNRVQRSVFLCTIPENELPELRHRIANMIDPNHDSVYFVRICATCRTSIDVHGQGSVEPTPLYWAVL